MNAHTKAILDQLDAHYGREYICYLNHENAWQLLIATMLSAQCTDARVNIVTKDLFVKYPSVEAFAEADLKELEQDIRPTGFYHNKAKNIIACCQRLMALHGGEVPSGLEELTALPGVGRKTANVIRADAYGIPGVTVDTHVFRISHRLGWADGKDPVKTEQELMQVLPEEHWNRINFQLIYHGRSICTARTAKCGQCGLNALCEKRLG